MPAEGTGRSTPKWLFMTVPIALLVAIPLAAFAALMWCGVSGCGGGGFGVNRAYAHLSVINCVLAGVIFGLSVGVVRWTRRTWL